MLSNYKKKFLCFMLSCKILHAKVNREGFKGKFSPNLFAIFIERFIYCRFDKTISSDSNKEEMFVYFCLRTRRIWLLDQSSIIQVKFQELRVRQSKINYRQRSFYFLHSIKKNKNKRSRISSSAVCFQVNAIEFYFCKWFSMLVCAVHLKSFSLDRFTLIAVKNCFTSRSLEHQALQGEENVILKLHLIQVSFFILDYQSNASRRLSAKSVWLSQLFLSLK